MVYTEEGEGRKKEGEKEWRREMRMGNEGGRMKQLMERSEKGKMEERGEEGRNGKGNKGKSW